MALSRNFGRLIDCCLMSSSISAILMASLGKEDMFY